MAPNVNGSIGRTPKSKLPRYLVRQAATVSPIAIPANVRVSPCRALSHIRRDHSYRRATMGSARMARRAGM
jgi:hypothetical protein